MATFILLYWQSTGVTKCCLISCVCFYSFRENAYATHKRSTKFPEINTSLNIFLKARPRTWALFLEFEPRTLINWSGRKCKTKEKCYWTYLLHKTDPNSLITSWPRPWAYKSKFIRPQTRNIQVFNLFIKKKIRIWYILLEKFGTHKFIMYVNQLLKTCCSTHLTNTHIARHQKYIK
jgi:hypothetical protein